MLFKKLLTADSSQTVYKFGKDVGNAMGNVGFRLYLCFLVSFLLHLPARFLPLAEIRSDLLLMAAITLAIVMRSGTGERQQVEGNSESILWLLIAYVLVTLFLVKWPGSVLYTGIPGLAKSMVFFFFTAYLVDTEKKLAVLIAVFVGGQLFRVAEPLYMHVTSGYWGSSTYMGPGLNLNRLSGAPVDIINPNGLAYVILSILPFLHYFLTGRSVWKFIMYCGVFAILMYALALTESRTGLVGLTIFAWMVIWKGRYRFLAAIIVFAAIIAVPSMMSPLQRDRYLSTVDHHVAGGATAEGRVQGVIKTFEVGLQAPIFGHGLGTSEEANGHALGDWQPSHDLYTEVFEELGAVGVVIFLSYLWSIFKNVHASLRDFSMKPESPSSLSSAANALHVWIWVYLVTSLATYGLSSYEWYLIGGLALVIRRLVAERHVVDTGTAGSASGVRLQTE